MDEGGQWPASKQMKTTANSPSIRTPHRSVSRFIASPVTLAITIFLIAFGVRVLTWHDTRLEVGKVQTAVAENYKTVAQLLRQDGVRGFFSSSSPLADPGHLGHPPGYSVLLSLVRPGPGASDTPAQFLQIFFDALSAVLIFLIVAEMWSLGPAVIAGLMGALSPQLAWNSVLLLPDSLAVFPILLAVYLLALSRKHPRLLLFLLIGTLVGISCWLRANAMLMTIFFAAAVPFLIRNKSWWRSSLAIIFGTILIVLPLTVRNAIVFHRLIPVSLGAGQTLLEGIADYDEADRFNISRTDVGIQNQEAEAFHRPDYKNGLLSPDGVEREHWRLQRGFKVIRSHPVWFGSVMMRRTISMVRLERARLVSRQPTITHAADVTNVKAGAVIPPDELIKYSAALSPGATISLDSSNNSLTIKGDQSNYGPQVALSPFAVAPETDCIVEIPVSVENGRMKISVRNGSAVQSAAIVDPLDSKDSWPVQILRLPFISSRERTQIEFSNEATTIPPVVHVGAVSVYELGPARLLWTYYPRVVIHSIQRLFVTSIILPLALLGLGIVIIGKRRDALIVFSVVPLYFFCVQSVFHTEYRYVLAINYFLFAFAAVAGCWVGNIIINKVSVVRYRRSQKA
jgi:hypothetical protein